MQQSNMTLQRYGDDLIAKSCIVADEYETRTFNDVFMEGVDTPIRHSLGHYRPQDRLADLTDSALQSESHPYFRKGAPGTLYNNPSNANTCT